MTKENVIATINSFLVDEFEVDQDALSPEANLQNTLELDSLDYVDLVVVIESNFGFKLTGEDFKGIETLEDFYNLIQNRVAVN